MRVLVKGTGVAGLTAAFELARNGVTVEVCERNAEPFRGASWYAGGMLAPWCERENAEEPVLTLGQAALDWWDETTPALWPDMARWLSRPPATKRSFRISHRGPAAIAGWTRRDRRSGA